MNQRSKNMLLFCPHCEKPLRLEQGIQMADLAMARLYQEGKTLEEIGVIFGMTRERVRQRLKKLNFVRRHGGNHIRSLSRGAALAKLRIERTEKYCQESYGCSAEEFRALTGGHPGRRTSLTKLYKAHQANARRNQIPWELPLKDWLTLTRDHLHKRWRGEITLSRKDKTKGFTTDNTEVLSLAENSAKTFRSSRARVNARREEVERLSDGGMTPTEIHLKTGVPMGTIIQWIYRLKNQRLFQA